MLVYTPSLSVDLRGAKIDGEKNRSVSGRHCYFTCLSVVERGKKEKLKELKMAHGGEEIMGVEERKAYQTKLKAGFVTNKLVKKPSVKGGVIYNIIDKETTLFRGDRFLPTWDSTDHLQFVCQKCKTAADILRIKFDTNYARPPNPKYALFFYLGCPSCGASGQRKVYLDLTLAKWFNQIAFDDNKIYIYGRERKPVKVIKVEARTAKKENKP